MYSPVAEIRLDRLIRNFLRIKAQVGDAVMMPVVKANGYGHGAVQVSRALQGKGAGFFGVFTVGEALELRENGIEGDIFIFSRMTEDALSPAVEHDLTLNISWPDDVDTLIRFIGKNRRSPKVHLKVDTGMTRLGVPMEQTEAVVKRLAQHPEINLEGIYSHLATADEGDPAYANLQIDRFARIIDMATAMNMSLKYIHIANSGAVLDLPQSYFNMVRVGMLMYGAFPSDETAEGIEVEPVMNFKGPVVVVRRVKAGTPISYGKVYRPDRDAYIGVIQTGFADGFPRNWYERGYVGFKGKTYRIAGRVCMDQLMVDFRDDQPDEGEEVLFFGDDGENRIRLEEIARDIGSTPYVLMTGIGGRTERVYEGSESS
ncbi:MAG: alanine racemase [Fidelibacterota bacterium]